MEKSWEKSSKWYDSIVGKKGHYYHENVILPKLIELMELKKISSLLDLACGQGIFSKQLPKSVEYVGVDLSKSLIQSAKKSAKNKKHQFFVKDLEKDLDLEKKDFDAALILLALQNIEKTDLVIKNAKKHLKKGGKFYIVLNHPCFRIPRQTSWEVDERAKIQYRRLNGYMSKQKIPIQTNPSKKDSALTFSYHIPLSTLTECLCKNGFMIEKLEEWCSDKKSTGKKAKMENRARKEFPLFLCIIAQKQ